MVIFKLTTFINKFAVYLINHQEYLEILKKI